MPQQLRGFRELSAALKALAPATGGSVLRTAARRAMIPVLNTAVATMPQGNPPYPQEGRKAVQPYPKKTHKGKLTAPGFASRNMRIATSLSRDKTRVRAMVGPRSEAFYVTQFLEVGTSSHRRTPFLVPALEQNQQLVISTLRTELRKAMERKVRALQRKLAK